MTDKIKPSFYAIIPADVRYADITPNAKLLYGEITALCSKEGFCWAGNSYFGNLYKVESRTVRRWLAELSKIGAIIVSDTTTNRHIELGTKMSAREDKIVRLPKDKIVRNSITKSITTLNKDSEDKSSQEIAEIIDMFKVVNLSYKKWFGRKDMREAVKRLLVLFPRPQLDKIINFLPTVNASNKYAPKAYTPVQLEDKVSAIKDWVATYRQSQNSKGKDILGL